MTRIPGYPGGCTHAVTKGESPLGTSRHTVKTLTIIEGVHPKLIIDGTYFMSFASGAIDGWLY